MLLLRKPQRGAGVAAPCSLGKAKNSSVLLAKITHIQAHTHVPKLSGNVLMIFIRVLDQDRAQRRGEERGGDGMLQIYRMVIS